MSGLEDSNTTDSYDQEQIVIHGGTDNTKIGNVGDRLKTEGTAQVTFTTGEVLSWNSKLRWLDMNTANGGVARDTGISTTFTNVFSYTGSGYFLGFLMSLEDKTNWFIRLVVDEEDLLLDSSGISTADMTTKNLYGWEPGDTGDLRAIGLMVRDETISMDVPLYAIRFTTSIQIKVKHATATKKFRAGLVLLEKLT